ncbi:G8 domain-containing protein [Candidatus Entotheonella palauensis]|nr:G8 domain-containing protein [Candidatus Entotheonella palauensis]
MAIVILPLVLNRLADAAGRGSADRAGQGVKVTDSHVITPYDRVPRACGSPTVVARRSGGWSQKTIWSTGRVPGAEAAVLIPAGMTVTYDVTQVVKLRCIEVQGRLRFGSRNAVLYVSDLQVLPGGSLVMGTLRQPIAPCYQVEIVIRDTDLQTGSKRRPGRDSEQYLTGLAVWGELTIHGAPLERSFIRLARAVRAGESQLKLRHVPRGWRVGDEVVIPDTRQTDPVRASYQPAWETHVIEAIEGPLLTLTKLIAYDHPGARDADPGRTPTVLRDGTWLLPHAANLSRNVIIRSERATGTRGHVYFAGRAKIDVRYARWQDLGRTRAEPLDSSGDGTAAPYIGTNQDGRHAMHFRHVMGPRPEQNRGYQFVALGNVITGSAKWGLVLHDTHFGLVKDNVAFEVDGAGVVTSAGNEVDNLTQVASY